MKLKELLEKLEDINEEIVFVNDFTDTAYSETDFDDYMLEKSVIFTHGNNIEIDGSSYSVYKLCDLKVNDFFD